MYNILNFIYLYINIEICVYVGPIIYEFYFITSKSILIK